MNKAILRLMAGFRRFREKYYLQEDTETSIYQKLASEGQTPKTLLIGCSDSRVDPAILTGASPGELFVIRNVANLVPPYEPSAVGFRGTSSGIEFAVVSLKVENIIILGHRQCGGIRALISKNRNLGGNFVNQWMTIAEEARQKVYKENPGADEDTLWRKAEMESIRVSLNNLKSFPFIKDALNERRLNIIGIYFDLEQGQLWEFDETSEKFHQLEI